jgi:hypothetical protein
LFLISFRCRWILICPMFLNDLSYNHVISQSNQAVFRISLSVSGIALMARSPFGKKIQHYQIYF